MQEVACGKKKKSQNFVALMYTRKNVNYSTKRSYIFFRWFDFSKTTSISFTWQSSFMYVLHRHSWVSWFFVFLGFSRWTETLGRHFTKSIILFPSFLKMACPVFFCLVKALVHLDCPSHLFSFNVFFVSLSKDGVQLRYGSKLKH